jgi:hypothetical protein
MNVMNEYGETINLNPYYDERLRADSPITLLGFIDILKEKWKKAGKNGKIVRHAPFSDETEFPLITYRLIHREISDDFKEVKPRYRTTIIHPDNPEEFIELKGQIFECLVEFDIFSQTAEEADTLVEELDDFILTYKGFFKMKGVQEILFHCQYEDQAISDFKFPIAFRPIQYIIRFEKITPIFLSQIQEMAIDAEIAPQAQIKNVKK